MIAIIALSSARSLEAMQGLVEADRSTLFVKSRLNRALKRMRRVVAPGSAEIAR